MIIVCMVCGHCDVKHDRSSHRVKGLCPKHRAERLARIMFLSTRYPAAFAPILRHVGKGKLARVAKR